MDAFPSRAYNAVHDASARDHYSNYLPGALSQEPPGQGVWATAPPSYIQTDNDHSKDATDVRRHP
jgi:hypothetical protein